MLIKAENFWKYSYSNFLDNANRGALAEYIVAKALDVENVPPSSWESYDILTPEGVKVEVKASGYLQSWPQKRLSHPSFGIAKRQGWIKDTSDLDGIYKRRADVYIFCLHKEKMNLKDLSLKQQVEQKILLNPLNTDNWRFWVVPTALLDSKLGHQKSLGISTLEQILNVNSIEFDQISHAVKSIRFNNQQNL